MYYVECGAEIEATHEFCPKCGIKKCDKTKI